MMITICEDDYNHLKKMAGDTALRNVNLRNSIQMVRDSMESSLKDALNMDFEDLPLYLKSDDVVIKAIVKARLEKGWK